MSSNSTEQMHGATSAFSEGLKLATEPLASGSMSPFLSAVQRLGLSDLPWMVPLAHVDLALSPQQSVVLVQQINAAENEITAWVKNPFQENAKGAFVIGSIATYSLLTATHFNQALERNPCLALPQMEGCIKLSGASIVSIEKVYDWPLVVERATRALSKYETQPVLASVTLGNDAVANLYSIFHNSKRQGKAAKIVANLVLASMGLRYAMEGKEIPETWDEVKSLKAEELLEYRSSNRNVGPRILLLPLHQALAVSPIMLLETKDLMGKYVARHWPLIMWKHLGSGRPEILTKIENIIWNTVSQISINPGNISEEMKALRTNLKTLTAYDEKANEMQIEIMPNTRSFFRQLEPLFAPSLSVKEVTTEAQNRQDTLDISPRTPHSSMPKCSGVDPQQTRSPTPPTNPPSAPAGSGLDPRQTRSPSPPTNPHLLTPAGSGVDPLLKRSPSRPRSLRGSDGRNAGNKGAGDDNDPDKGERSGDESHKEDEDEGIHIQGTKRKHIVDSEDDDTMAGPSTQQHAVSSDESDNPLSYQRRLQSRRPTSSNDTPLSQKRRKVSQGGKTGGNNSQQRSPAKPSRFKSSPAQTRQTKPPSSVKKRGLQVAKPGKKGEVPLAAVTPINRKVKASTSIPPMLHLIGTSTEERFSAPPTSLFDIHGQVVQLRPSFHREEDRESFNALIRGIQRKCGDAPPGYTSGDGNSALFQSIPFDVYRQWPPSQIAETLKTKAILVTGLPVQAPQTFADALRGLNRFLDASIVCSDQSISMGPSGGERHRKTTLEEMITISNTSNAKAINCLDFPGPLPAGLSLVFDDTLDRVCYSATWSYLKPRETADMSALTWTTATTPSSWHHLHVDTNGFGTVSISTFGRKLWALIRRKDDPFSSRPIDWQSELRLLDNTVLDSENYEVEYAILEPGTALVMPGGCPHMVVTLEDSAVFMGSHYYHGRAIRRHMFSLIMTAALPHSTNTWHNKCAISIIGQVIEMISKACFTPGVVPNNLRQHLPDVTTTDGMKDVLVVCVIGRLLPVIFHSTDECTAKVAIISSSAIRLARLLQTSEKHRFTTDTGRPLDFIEDIYEVYLHQVCRIRLFPECKDFQPGFKMGPGVAGNAMCPKEPDSLSDSRLDLAVECFVNFIFVDDPSL